jgi:uncharacterized protein (TIGR02145 family)
LRDRYDEEPSKTPPHPAYRSFAENATDYGAYFRWDDPTQYFYGDNTTVSNVFSPSTTWLSANDPCPDGWRVPTWPEYNALLTAATTKTWGASGGINGVTYTSPNGTLFFPAGGHRDGSSSTDRTTRGFYWTSTQNGTTQVYFLYFDSPNPGGTTYTSRFNAFTIRCVRPYVTVAKNPVGEVLVEGTYRTVYWAKSNVGTTAKTFATAATAYGGYYKWDDDTPYTYTGGTTPPETNSSATSWQSANNPCPAGWEVPTNQDYLDLLAASTETWGPSGTINGTTVVATKGTLFFPAAGHRYSSTSAAQTTVGWYWSSEQSTTDATAAYRLRFESTNPGDTATSLKYNAFPLRCVRPKIE